MVKHVADELKELAKKKKKKRFHEIPDTEFLSTGVTLLNLAMTGRRNCGYRKGTYINTPGASDSGKTFLVMTAFAEACKNPNFADYRLIIDNAEGATPPPIKKYWGAETKRRIEFIQPSSTVEDFHESIQDICKQGPCIYFLDSSDALNSRAEDKAEAKGKGAFGAGAAKAWSKGFRKTKPAIEQSRSIVIIVSQTRQNINPFTAKFNPDVRSGGNALKFYNRMEMWLKTIGSIKAGNRKDRTLGQITKVKITKNHYNGWKGFITFPIDNDIGVDDLRGCVQFLVTEGVWPMKKKVINAKELDIAAKMDELLQQIEFTEQEETVRKLVEDKWRKIEASLKVARKKRYE